MSVVEWSQDIETILENIRVNSILLSGAHKEKFYYYKSYLKYFKIPLIILSSITSIASVGLSGYLQQKTISMITCLLSLVSAIIGSIELYLGIQKNMETELLSSRSFILLSYDIYKVLNLTRDNRPPSGKAYLDEKYNEYTKLVESSNLVNKRKIKDSLAPIPISIKKALKQINSALTLEIPSSPSNSGSNSSDSDDDKKIVENPEL